MSNIHELITKIHVVRLSKTSDVQLIRKNIQKVHSDVWWTLVRMRGINYLAYSPKKDMAEDLFDYFVDEVVFI